MKLAKYLENNVTNFNTPDFRLAKKIKCQSGLSMSIQASSGHYCEPREMLPYKEYTSFEIGFPSEVVPELVKYAEDPEHPTDTVYPYVPVEIIEKIIEDNGGIYCE